MDLHRKIVLVVGPILLIGTSFLLSFGDGPQPRGPLPPSSINVRVAEPLKNDAESRLRQACETTAQDLHAQLDRSCAIRIQPPYVLAGDMSDETLDRMYRDVIQPTERALNVSFFDARPTEPITILAFRDEATFRDFARRVDRRPAAAYYGYYIRSARRIVVNVSTGAGTLAHELTHALGHFDFPNMPEWFDEGLASLFEQSEFTERGNRLTGTDNWRVHQLLRALHANKLRPTNDLVNTVGTREENQSIDYAHARYLCLFLQDQQLLEPFYRKLRSRSEADTTGWQTLSELLTAASQSDLDTDFRRWVVKYHKTQRQRTARTGVHALSMRAPVTGENVIDGTTSDKSQLAKEPSGADKRQ